MATELNGHRVVHRGEDAPEHQVGEAEVRLRLGDQEILQLIVLSLG